MQEKAKNHINKEQIPFIEKFMLPSDDYEIFKFGSSSLKDEERGIRIMLQYFSNYFTEAQLEQIALQYGLEESIGAYIVYNYIIVLLEDARKRMIFLGEDTASRTERNCKCN